MSAKQFSGTNNEATASRPGPIQFEKDEEDPFGLNEFLQQAKQTSKRGCDDDGGRPNQCDYWSWISLKQWEEMIFGFFGYCFTFYYQIIPNNYY